MTSLRHDWFNSQIKKFKVGHFGLEKKGNEGSRFDIRKDEIRNCTIP